MRLLVLEHQRDAPAGLLADWAAARDHELSVTRVAEESVLPFPGDGEVLVSLGSDRSLARPDAPWIDAELACLRAAHDADRPVLGICFGGQAVAAALGGEVLRAPRVAIEWSEIQSRDEDLVGRGPWFRWHEDYFSVPPGAREVAEADGVPMAFTSRGAIGLQFHPEVTGAIAGDWIALAGRELAGGALDAAALRQRIADGLPGSVERAYELFDAFATHWRVHGLL